MSERTRKQTAAEKRKQYLFVIHELTSREIKRKYARSYLGVIWSVLNPLLTMLVMTMIFSYMFRRNIANFPIYYLTGTTFWTLFSTATNQSMSALVDNRMLLMKVKLPKQTFVLSRIYTALVNFLYTCIAFALILVIQVLQGKIVLTWNLLLFPVDVLFTTLFAMGIGYILSIIYVFFADIKYLYSVLLTLWMYMSAIFYPVDNLPETLKYAIGYNPVYVSIVFARHIVLDGVVPEWTLWIKLIVFGIGSFLIGYLVFAKNENKVMQRI